MRFFFIFLLFTVSIFSKYLDNHSCSECHEKIYNEYQSSMHSKSYFTDELHRKVANKADAKKYDCAVCHMPAADNLQDLVTGRARPDKNNVTQTDGVSCYYCHTIAYVKKAHYHNINVLAKQNANKPTFYGGLKNAEDSDKHYSLKNPIYAKNACIGCHSFKLNDNNVTIFKATAKNQDSLGCIKCHMPKVAGGVEKMNKRNRKMHLSHRFLGIHDADFRKKGVDINATAAGKVLKVTLINKMPHPLIIQPARAKFLKIEVLRDGKTVWQNYKNSPKEDKRAYFAYSFIKDGKEIIVPSDATAGFVHNLGAKEVKTLTYNIPVLKKGDKIKISLYVQLAKSDCTKAITLKDKLLLKPQLIKNVTIEVN